MANKDALTRIERARKAGHNMIMLCEPSSIPELHRIVVESVEFDTDKDAGDVYFHSTSKKWMIHHKGLGQLALAAGVEWDTVQSRPITVQSDYIAYAAVGCIRREFNKTVCFRGDAEMDMPALKDELEEEYRGKARSYKKDEEWVRYCVDRDYRFKRKHRIKLTATSAKSVVIMKLLGLKSGYSENQIKQPFTVVRCVVAPDLSDPEIQRAISMNVVNGVFGRQQEPLALAHEPLSDEPIDVPHETIEEQEPDSPPSIPDNLESFNQLGRGERDRVIAVLIEQKGYNTARLPMPPEDIGDRNLGRLFDTLTAMPDAEDDIPF